MFWPSIRDFYYWNVRSKSNRTIQKKFAVYMLEPAVNQTLDWPRCRLLACTRTERWTAGANHHCCVPRARSIHCPATEHEVVTIPPCLQESAFNVRHLGVTQRAHYSSARERMMCDSEPANKRHEDMRLAFAPRFLFGITLVIGRLTKT